jgi:hypothetical protein
MGNDRVMRQVKWNHSIGAGCNRINRVIYLHPAGQDDNWSKAANTDPLQRSLLVRGRMANSLHHDQVAVGYHFAQGFIRGTPIDGNSFIGDLIHYLLHFVTVGTTMIQQRDPR